MNLDTYFKKFSDTEFHLEIQVMAKEERRTTLKMIHAIQEVENRHLHSKTGHASVFDYCTRVLGYSETAALRRIRSARLLREVPEAELKVESGELKISQLSSVQTLIQVEKKQGNPLHKEEKLKLLEEVSGQSTRETERLLLKASPALQSNRKTEEKIRVLNEEITELKLPADAELLQLFEEAKALLACPQSMNPSMVQILKDALPLLIEKKKREKMGIKPIRTQNAPPAPALTPMTKEVETPSTRFIPISLKRAVFERAKGQCEFISPVTGECCMSRHALEIHHLQNYSQGGAHSLANLKVFCHSHNATQARIDFPWLKSIRQSNRH